MIAGSIRRSSSPGQPSRSQSPSWAIRTMSALCFSSGIRSCGKTSDPSRATSSKVSAASHTNRGTVRIVPSPLRDLSIWGSGFVEARPEASSDMRNSRPRLKILPREPAAHAHQTPSLGSNSYRRLETARVSVSGDEHCTCVPLRLE